MPSRRRWAILPAAIHRIPEWNISDLQSPPCRPNLNGQQNMQKKQPLSLSLWTTSAAGLLCISIWADNAAAEPAPERLILPGETVTTTIMVTVDDFTIDNRSAINITSAGGKGGKVPTEAIFVPGGSEINTFTLENQGTISANGTQPLAFRTDGRSTIINKSGASITSAASDPMGHVIDVSSGTLDVFNSGRIGTSTYERSALEAFNGGTLRLRNDPAGQVISAGTSNTAIDGYRLPNGAPSEKNAWGRIHVNNAGLLAADGEAISLASSSSVVNTGRITGGKAAITANGDDNTVTLGRGSTIIGELVAKEGTTGNRLVFDVGPSASFAYETSGPWELVDKDGRPVVSGSALWAGIGNVEAADELMFERSRNLRFSLDRIARQSRESAGKVFVDSYQSQTLRERGSDYARLELEDHGFVVASSLDFLGHKSIAFANYHAGDLNVDHNTQEITSTSWRFGLVAPDFWRHEGFAASGYVALGTNRYDGTRELLVNQNTTTGVTDLDASWDSTEVEVGLDVEHQYSVTPKLQLVTLAGLSTQIEQVSAYTESDHFAWDDRKIVQGHGRLDAKLDYAASGAATFYAAGGIWSRDIWGGVRWLSHRRQQRELLRRSPERHHIIVATWCPIHAFKTRRRWRGSTDDLT